MVWCFEPQICNASTGNKVNNKRDLESKRKQVNKRKKKWLAQKSTNPRTIGKMPPTTNGRNRGQPGTVEQKTPVCCTLWCWGCSSLGRATVTWTSTSYRVENQGPPIQQPSVPNMYNDIACWFFFLRPVSREAGAQLPECRGTKRDQPVDDGAFQALHQGRQFDGQKTPKSSLGASKGGGALSFVGFCRQRTWERGTSGSDESLILVRGDLTPIYLIFFSPSLPFRFASLRGSVPAQPCVPR